MEKLGYSIGVLAGAVALLIGTVLLDAWSINAVWRWHVERLWAIPAPGLLSCIGLSALMACLVPRYSNPNADDAGVKFAWGIASRLLTIFIAWISYLLS